MCKTIILTYFLRNMQGPFSALCSDISTVQTACLFALRWLCMPTASCKVGAKLPWWFALANNYMGIYGSQSQVDRLTMTLTAFTRLSLHLSKSDVCNAAV